MTWIALPLGALLVLVVFASALQTLVVPRGGRSSLARWVEVGVRAAFSAAARRRSRYEDRDRILAGLGPALLISLLGVWVLLLLAGYALMLWPFSPSIGEAVRLSGSSMFTLGIAGATDAAPTALVFLAAASGLVVVALLIAYLPTVYGAFARRETLVTMLESRAGAPAWGPEILARYELVDIDDTLVPLYLEWERWAAEVAESHTSYPALMYFRSPVPLRSWVIALLAVLDAAALHLATQPLSAPSQARLAIRMGFTALRDIARALGIPFDADPLPEAEIRLTREEFEVALDNLRSVGWRMERSGDEVWQHFRGWRVNYESVAWAIADLVDAPPALWSGPRTGVAQTAMAPARPPHRNPKYEGERRRLLEQTAARRAARPGVSGRRVVHVHDGVPHVHDETAGDVVAEEAAAAEG